LTLNIEVQEEIMEVQELKGTIKVEYNEFIQIFR